jgi:hypothetical protein
MEPWLLLQFALGVAIILSADLIRYGSIRAYAAYKKKAIPGIRNFWEFPDDRPAVLE